MTNKKVLGVIPARGGSKGIPNKNIVEICGKPLINYTVEAALKSRFLTHCVVSTDSEKIASIARAAGGLVPFIRPAELSTDSALSLPVILHALEYMEMSERVVYDALVMLQPTTPLRSVDDIDNALELLFSPDVDSVISVVDVDAYHPLRMKRIVNGHLINYIDQGYEDMRPRQQLPPVYIRNGAVYAARRDVLIGRQSFSGNECMAYIMPSERSVNIDALNDLFLVQYFLDRQ